MAASIITRAIVLVAWCALSGAAIAEDRPIDRDWRTGVTIAPGAKTWTADNYKQKQNLINETATARGKTCSDYAFIGWPPSAGDIQEIMATTRKHYETDGWAVVQTQGDISTDTIWTARKDGREAVIMWGGVMGSTIYLSCLTAGSPPSDPIRTLLVGILLAIGAIALPLLATGLADGPGRLLMLAALVIALAAELTERYLFFVSVVPKHLAAPYIASASEAA